MIAFLLIGSISSILFGGMQNLLDYRKSVDSNVAVNFTTLRFFTKEYINRRLTKLMAAPPEQDPVIPTFSIFTDEKDIESLNSNLPASGKTRYISGHVKINKPSLESEMQFRYRGGLPLHWLYDKKSFRLKLPPYVTYLGERQFNLVNPSTIQTLTDWVSYDMARSLGLLTPDYFPIRVNINNVTNGLHYFLSRIDESFLRKNHRMPGSIYSGDTIYSPNPFGVDKRGVNESTFKDKDGIPLMWVDERLWKKDASRNAESVADRSDIKTFIEIINKENPAVFMNLFETYFDKEKYYNYWGLDVLLGSYHHDNFHNHKLYFDPYKGKFEPIEWDIRFWSSNFLAKDIPLNKLLKQVKLNPVYEYERDKAIYKLLDKFPVSDVFQRIDIANRAIEGELHSDPVRHAPDHRFGRFKLNKEVSFKMSEYYESVELLKLTYQSRHKYLKELLDNCSVKYTLNNTDRNSIKLQISVTGNSPIEFNPWTLIPKNYSNNVNINRLYQDRKAQVSIDDVELLYPGRSIKIGNILGRTDNWSILAFGNERLEPSPLQYEYLIEGLADTQLLNENLSARNATTGGIIKLDQVEDIPSTTETASVHPWGLPTQDSNKDSQIVLSGEIDITEDRVYSGTQMVKILPGTVFRIAKGKSLIFYSRVLAEGSEALPIRFLQKKAGEPWGSIVIHGTKASGSHLSHVEINGGSVTRHRLIQYPAQINIHDVENFKLEHCSISNNQIGDDALHIAYSHGEIRKCLFEKTAFDALDIDIGKVKVSNSEFINIGNDAIDLMNSNVTVEHISVNGTGDKCISVGEETELRINNAALYNCNIGVAVKDNSKAFLDNIMFHDNKDIAIALYQKNPRYNAGGTINAANLHGIDENDIRVSQNSINNIQSDAFINSTE
ncbi:MAG: CotH kinase family protein [Candidatus Thiodiazotropha sp. (ex Codakia rugifera)]|nr:CotH kinase family protein [Candidatus Thiodiazotropha sp. (ex Codakia rugifera)]